MKNFRKNKKARDEMKVYVITQGEYSDYHICGVALDEERAEAIRKHFDREWDNTDIEVYDTETYSERNLLTSYMVTVSKSGDDVEVFNENPFASEEKTRNSYRFDRDGTFIACVVANDRDHALKIALDKRAKMLSEKLLI